MTIERSTFNRYALVNAGHHFLLNFLPIRTPDSSWALNNFLAAAERNAGNIPELDAVLLRCLAVIDNGVASRRIPSLVDRYISSRAMLGSPLQRFGACLEDLLKYAGVGDGTVQHAIDLIHTNCNQVTCTPRGVAHCVGQRLSSLAVAFKRATGYTIGEYIRDARLHRAALLLASTDKSIKQVWADVGYNHASNFDHDFKRHFRVTPSEFRETCMRPVARQHFSAVNSFGSNGPEASERAAINARVLIVDDDETSAMLLSHYLRSEGLTVSVTATATSGLAKMRAGDVDVVLLDYRLPDFSGLEVLRRLREDAACETPQIALFTSDWEIFEQTAEVNDLGAIVVSKLCDLRHVLELITYLCERPSDECGAIW